MNPQFEDSHPNCELNFKNNTSNQYQQNKDDTSSKEHIITETNAQTNTVSGDTMIKSKHHDKLTDEFSQNCTNQIKNSDLAQNFRVEHPYSEHMQLPKINDDCNSVAVPKNS